MRIPSSILATVPVKIPDVNKEFSHSFKDPAVTCKTWICEGGQKGNNPNGEKQKLGIKAA